MEKLAMAQAMVGVIKIVRKIIFGKFYFSLSIS